MNKADFEKLLAQYEQQKAKHMSLNMARGCPSAAQLELSMPMMTQTESYLNEDGADCRNYGLYTGIPEAKRLFGQLLGVDPSLVIIGGNSSINLIHDALTRAMLNGPLPGFTPWAKLDKVKFVCPVPGYDWHFYMCDKLGIEILTVPMLDDGPDMDAVEQLVRDPQVKGMICVPMYSNPTGVTFSDRVVDRLAAMETAAPDFRIIWDNAYCVHHLYEEDSRRSRLKNIYDACCQYGHEDRVLMFTSTSKITFPGCGISAMAASPRNIEYQSSLLMYQLVCYDKMNQLRHTNFLPDLDAVTSHMKKHAAIMRPKFRCVLDTMERELKDIARWSDPNGGYFICFYAPNGCAKRIVELCQQAGVSLTPAGSPYPHGYDKDDSLLRIAPTFPTLDELRAAMEIFVLAVRIAAVEVGAL